METTGCVDGVAYGAPYKTLVANQHLGEHPTTFFHNTSSGARLDSAAVGPPHVRHCVRSSVHKAQLFENSAELYLAQRLRVEVRELLVSLNI